MIVEEKDVKFFEVKELSAFPNSFVRIDGLIFHSSYVVDEIKIINEDRKAIVLVSIIPTKPKLSGRFKIDVPIGNDIDKIEFGNSRAQIWSK